MNPSLTAQVRDSLAASRRDADRILAESEARAQAITRGGLSAGNAATQARLRQLEEIRADIADGRRRIEAAYVTLAQGMAATTALLVDASRNADFSPPPWPGGIGRTVEIKLSETREVTLRYERGA